MRTLNTTRTRSWNDAEIGYWSLQTNGNTSSGSGLNASIDIVTDDVVTPNFKKLVSEGVTVVNDYHHKDERESGMEIDKFVNKRTQLIDGSPQVTWNQSGTYHTDALMKNDIGNPIPYITLAYPYLDNLVDLAVTQAYARIDPAKFQSFVTAAEAHKSLNSFNKTFEKAADFLAGGFRVKRKLLRGLLKPKEAANAWLHYRYGLRPLYYEMRNLIRAIEDPGKPPRAVYFGYSEYDSSDSDTVVYDNWSSLTRTFSRASDRKIRVRAGVRCEPRISPPSWKTTFGLDDLGGTAWELVPFSFVADWFLNIGDVIASWSPKAGVKVLGSWVVVREGYTRQVRYLGGDSKWTDADTISHEVKIERTDFKPLVKRLETNTTRRWAHPNKPLIPSLDINLDVSKLVDILALLRSLKG